MTAIQSLNPGAHLVVLHRWRDAYALYHDYIDHDLFRVTYVATSTSAPSVPAGAAAVVEIDDITDLGEVLAGLAEPVRALGRPAAVVALQEGDLPVASRLREQYGCPGRRWADLHRFFDKHAMLDAAAGTGVAVPAYRKVTSAAEIADFVREFGWPVIVKPLEGRASAGVSRLGGPEDIAALGNDLGAPLLVQRHVPHPVYHVNGYFNGRDIGPWRVARYVNVPGSAIHGPLAFNHDEPVGEVEVTDARLRASVESFLRVVIPGMSPEPWVFHCELFVDDSAKSPECIFLEVGCRPGGGEIPFVWRDVYGIDLMGLEFALQCGSVPQAPREPTTTQVGGSLLVPLAGPRPARVSEVTSMLDRPDGPYAEWVPEVGTIIPSVTGTYEYVGGRFRFSDKSTEDVVRRIDMTAREYVVCSSPVFPVASQGALT